jgi:hypothetical protein
MKLTKVISAKIQGAISYVKYLGLGKSDVQETPQISPYGIDSAPIKDMVGLYVETGVKGENVLIGYIFKNAVALPGEIKLYSQNDAGVEQAFIHLKNNGDIYFKGDDDNLVRWGALNTAQEEIVDKLNELIGSWNSWCNAYVPGSPVFTGLPATAVSLVVNPTTANISAAKIEALKCAQDD